MLVYALTVGAALIVAAGEVVQQRTAANARPEDNLSIRLLLWLVRQPRWLAGVGFSTGGNILFAFAVGFGNLVLVEAVFVVRLLFALILAAVAGRHRVPLRDLLGSLAITIGLVAFLVVAEPHKGSSAAVPPLHWAVGGGTIVAAALVLTVIAARSGPARKAALLGAGAGGLFGLQAALTQSAIHVLRTGGVLGLLATWNGYAVIVIALSGMLLVQSAFEAAPLPASYPAVVTTELIAGIVVGIVVLGGTIELGVLQVLAGGVSLVVMIVGIVLLTTSPLVTGQMDELIRTQDLGQATRIEERLARELAHVERLATAGRSGGARRLGRQVARIEQGIDRLCGLQDEMRRHRESELEHLDGLDAPERERRAARSRDLLARERAVDEQAGRLREHADALKASIADRGR